MDNLIKSIEIRYFRSIYRVRIRGLRSLNILSGRNDAGKSNILKALNLFFNKKTDWQTALVFYRDFSNKRLTEVRKESIKGKQFISIEIEFNRPNSYKDSLPESFKVKRTWHRDSSEHTETNNLEAIYNPATMPQKLKTAKRFMAMLLNKIHFEYVPAVKDRIYFEHLLSVLQKNLLDIPLGSDTTLSSIAENLASHLQGKVDEINNDFERATAIKSNIEPPKEIAALFQAFQVATETEDNKIPLSLRGDGIQGRYVPSVLQYISRRSSQFFIWGFEEPENSLEYTHVIELVEDFQQRYTNSAQIFVTTHSPAFTSLKGDNNTCYRVFKKDGVSEIRSIHPLFNDKTEEVNKFNLEMGFMKIQESLHEEYVKKIEELDKIRERTQELEAEIINTHKPLVLTEGKIDKLILDTSWSKLFPNDEIPFIIRSADTTSEITDGGSGGATSLAKMIESIHPEEGRLAIALFDRDREGIKAFDKLSGNFEGFEQFDDIKKHKHGMAYAMLLPTPPSRIDYAMQENLPIELLFRDEILSKRTTKNLGLIFAELPIILSVNGRTIDPNQYGLSLAPLFSNINGLKRIVSGKKIFAQEIVPNLEPSEFGEFLVLFDSFLYIISKN